jgi:alpha-aminoadipic semialdehyde synthase
MFLISASNNLKEAESLKKGRENIRIISLDINSSADLDELVRNNDVVVSFIPATMHLLVANCCIKHKKHMVTASYTSNSISALNEEFYF